MRNLPTKDELVRGRVYQLRSRNLGRGVWDGSVSFIGIREKFGDRYLDREFHWDEGPPFGTVVDATDTGIDVPEGVELRTYGTDVDQNGRAIWKDTSLENPMGWPWKGWYRYSDTGEICPKKGENGFSYYGTQNQPLFDFLDQVPECKHRP